MVLVLFLVVIPGLSIAISVGSRINIIFSLGRMQIVCFLAHESDPPTSWPPESLQCQPGTYLPAPTPFPAGVCLFFELPADFCLFLV